jgi:hypothetical protein
MANAEALLASETATASELQAAYDGIKTAKAGLVTQKKADALEELAPQITGAETLLGQKDTYTAESLAALEAAYKEAVAIQANSAASAEEVAAAMNKVKAAAANLKKQPVAVTEEQTKVGTTFTYKNATYKVTSANTVSFVKPLKKTNSKFTVPATASKDGVTYKVTAIEKNAFKGNKKLKAVTVGKNVTSIGANAFSGDGKLKKITVKSKVLKSVGKKALKGISSSATVKVPKAKKAAYQKLFKGKGQKASVKIK